MDKPSSELKPQQYQLIFDKMLNGFALHQIVLDDQNNPIDYIFLETNPAFSQITGIQKDSLIGKKVTQVIPDIENDPADWIGKYGHVAITGQEAKFEQFSQPLNKWFSVSAYSPQPNQFATIFEDITNYKNTLTQLELKIEELKKLNQTMVGRELKMADLKKQLHQRES